MRQRTSRLTKQMKQFLRALPLLYRSRHNRSLTRIFSSYIGVFPLCIFTSPFTWIRNLIRSQKRFERPDQYPHRFYVPDLKTLPFAPQDKISKYLEDNFETISNEYRTIAPKLSQTPSKNLIAQGAWNTFPLIRAAKRIEKNIEKCPQTWAIVEQCPLPWGALGGVYFSILSPCTKIAPHCGPSNLKYRYHLTIKEAEGAMIRSGSEWRTWEEGKCLILDDSFEHEVAHEGNHERVVLIVDCWRSDLTADERNFLTHLHKRWS